MLSILSCLPLHLVKFCYFYSSPCDFFSYWFKSVSQLHENKLNWHDNASLHGLLVLKVGIDIYEVYFFFLYFFFICFIQKIFFMSKLLIDLSFKTPAWIICFCLIPKGRLTKNFCQKLLAYCFSQLSRYSGVKHCQAWLVLGWTIWQYELPFGNWLLLYFANQIIVYHFSLRKVHFKFSRGLYHIHFSA